MKGKSLSRVRLLATPCTTAYQAPPSMGFSKQEYWSGVPSVPKMNTENNGELRVTEWTETSGVVIPGKTENIKRKED